MIAVDDIRKALLKANPALSRYNPLPCILFFDDFDEGINGWCELVGNHDGNLDSIPPLMRDFRPPQLSNCTFFDIGTHGSMNGTYALKLATRPRPNHRSLALKRLTFVQRGLVQFEMYFTYKVEATFDRRTPASRSWDGNFHPSESQFGDFTISNDVCDGDRRYHCALRYVNTDAQGDFVQRWMYKTSLAPTTKMQLANPGYTPVDFHVQKPEDWAEVPGGRQPLCYNEVPTKVNWHYLRWCFDTRERRNVELQVNDRVMDLRRIYVPHYGEPYWGLDQLLNFAVDVGTHTSVRNFLYIDSVLVSVDW
ncbi:MAG: hypothetical protein M0Z94_19945 [Dehalococcoidales bacterium]|nr:hypothetical protein [Dehalococcoidales bacterium]